MRTITHKFLHLWLRGASKRTALGSHRFIVNKDPFLTGQLEAPKMFMWQAPLRQGNSIGWQ